MLLEQLKSLKKTFYTSEDAKHFGFTPSALSYLVKKGELLRVSHGLYCLPDSQGIDLDSIIAEKLMQAPQAIIGLHTALRLFDLTEDNKPEIDLIVPLSNVPKRKMTDVKFYQVKDELYKKDVIKIRGIPTTSLERTIIDLLRIGEQLSSIIEIIKLAQKKKMKLSLSKIKRLSIEFRVKKKAETLLEVLI